MNAFLHQSISSNSYATFFYARIDESTLRMDYLNAGHNPPLLVRATGIVELSAGGTVLGLFPGMVFQAESIDLREGDLLVAFTDGVTEALNPNGVEFGDERLKQVLRSCTHLPALEISKRLSAELKRWIADAPQHDDLTVVVLKVASSAAH